MTNTDENRQQRIGARVVVELLRINADTPASKKIQLVDARSKNALAVLNDRMSALQQALAFPAGVTCVAQAVADACQDLQIPLPVARPDWGGILLLDSLFDKLSRDDQLDEEARQWLGYLRLPVVRYAILDYSFFFTPQNLMRRFLNQLHLVFLSSSQKSRQILRESLQPFLQRMQSEFRQDISSCNRICIEAQTWFASHSDRVGQIEAQLRTQEISLRKEQVAEPRVVRELNRVAGNKVLPKLVVEFLHGEWRRSLQLISMREGEEGPTWKRQIRITESLVEFAEGCGDDKGRDKYRSFYPVMMRNIKSLLVSVSDDAAAMEEAIDPLELILSALLSGAQPDMQETPLLETSHTPITAVAVKKVGAKALEQINALQTGDWVRIKTADGHHEVFRLTLKSETDEPWVLVSQSGKNVTKKTAFQLAQGLEGGVLDLIGQGQWWDEQLDQQLQTLHERWQVELASRPPPAPIQPRSKSEPEPAPEPAQTDLASDISLVELEEQASSYHAATGVAPSRTDKILENSSLQLVSEQPEPAAENKSDVAEDFLAPRPVTDEERQTALDAIDQIQIGGWITQQTSKGEERCKLAVRLRGRDKLIFVNRLGVKVLEIDRQPLAELLARGLVGIVDTGQKFDNTLERVVRSIQEDRKPS